MMYKKLLSLLVIPLFIPLGYGFAQQSLDFKDVNLSSGEIYEKLYLNSDFTSGWVGYLKDSCDIPESRIMAVSDIPDNLEEYSIYLLDTDKLSINKTIKVGDCTAIVGLNGLKGGTIIDNTSYSGDIFLITGKNSIINNIQISGEKKEQQYGIRIYNTNNVTINNVSIYGLFGGIYSEDSNNCKYNNIHVSNIFQYPFILKNSDYNFITNIESSNNIDEAGFQIEGSSFNSIKNIKSFQNKYQGIFIKSGSDNFIENAIISGNTSVGIRIKNGSLNRIYDSLINNNYREGILISSNNNSLSGITSYGNPFGIIISSSNNNLNNCIIFNNTGDGIQISGGEYNEIVSGYIYNNYSNGIELFESNKNTFSNLKIFNNGIVKNGIGYCGIRLYNKSNNNLFKNIYLFNNIFGICLNTNISNNTFEDMKILNNKTNESSNGQLTGNVFSGIITTFDLTKTGNLGGKTGKVTKTGMQLNLIELRTGDRISISGFNIIKPGHSLVQRVVKPSFEYMINPYVDDKYLYNWKSKYSSIIGYNSGFLSIKDKQPKYSIGIRLQDEVTGYIISNGINVVANGNITDYNIKGNKYAGNKIKNTLNGSINTGDVGDTIATNINGKDIHAMLVLDIEDPICGIEYSTTGATTENVIAKLTGCSEEIAGTDLSYPFTKNGTHTFEFTDLVGNSGSTEANVSRIKPKPSGNGVGGGGGGGGNTVKDETHNAASDSGNNNIKFSFYTGNFDSDYSEEMNMAYQYAYYYKITTQKPISAAGMDQGLTRIAMAKMLSMYAINVLGMRPNNNETAAFNDVSYILNSEYNNGVSLAYQLGIMGINMPNNEFRPFDPVTRAEFATALSRLLYGTKDGTDAYYSTHLDKLLEKGIISNTNPDLQELRGYVMIMLMRSALGISSTEDFVYPEPEPQGQEVVRYFTEPYKKGQIYSRIGDLQDLLRYLGYYKLGTNYVYSKATINAVYDFQVDMGLIDADDINNPAKGYLGPETRNALNEKWAEFQEYKVNNLE